MATPPSQRTLRLPSSHASGKAASKGDIYERIYEAVAELPGAKSTGSEVHGAERTKPGNFVSNLEHVMDPCICPKLHATGPLSQGIFSETRN